MNILLLGCNGQVGWELQRALAPLGQITAISREGRNGLCGDLTNLAYLAVTVQQVEPDVIVNAAAYTAVDRAESDARTARLVNTEAPGLLAREARKLGAWLVHYSTDYVFDGSGQRPWKEDDLTNPCNIYGVTKRDGEIAIDESGCRYLLFRTSWVYAARGSNFLSAILRLAKKDAPLRIVDDQFGAPTGAELVADVTAHALEIVHRTPGKAGIYHLTAGGETSWYEYARFIVENIRAVDSSIRVPDNAVEPVTTDAFPTVARRPRNSRLCCNRLQRTFQLQMPDWHAGVERAIRETNVQ